MTPCYFGRLASFQIVPLTLYTLAIAFANVLVTMYMRVEFGLDRGHVSHMQVVTEKLPNGDAEVVAYVHSDATFARNGIMIHAYQSGDRIESFDGESFPVQSVAGINLATPTMQVKIQRDVSPDISVPYSRPRSHVKLHKLDHILLASPQSSSPVLNFSTPYLSTFIRKLKLRKLHLDSSLEVGTLNSPILSDLQVTSESHLEVASIEGVHVRGKALHATSPHGVTVDARRSIHLDAPHIHMDSILSITSHENVTSDIPQSAMCICPRSGRLFASDSLCLQSKC